jgi:hypothetical protein
MILDLRYFVIDNKIMLHVTYVGLLKVLFSSKNKTVDKFIGQFTGTLFTAHLRTVQKKDKLVSKLMGISADIVKEVFNKTSSTLPVLYLLSIGKVKDLRVTFKIDDKYDDNDIVCKGGETDDLTRRIDEHNKTYGEMPGANLCLKYYNYIDPQYTSKAETELFQVLNKMGYKFNHSKYDELIIFSKKDSKIITDQYANIAGKYIGHVKEISDKLKEAENQIKFLKKENELNQEKANNELNKEKAKNELLKKDLEIMALLHKFQVNPTMGNILKHTLSGKKKKCYEKNY